MKKSSLYTVLLLLLISTASLGQELKPNVDTIRCYGITDLRAIAAKFDDGNRCEALLKNSNAKIAVKDSVIGLKDVELSLQSSEIVLQKSIISVKDNEIQSITAKFDHEVKRHKLTKLGWAGTAILLSAALIFVVVH